MTTHCQAHDAKDAPLATGNLTVTFPGMFTLTAALCDQCRYRVQHYGKKMIRLRFDRFDGTGRVVAAIIPG